MRKLLLILISVLLVSCSTYPKTYFEPYKDITKFKFVFSSKNFYEKEAVDYIDNFLYNYIVENNFSDYEIVDYNVQREKDFSGLRMGFILLEAIANGQTGKDTPQRDANNDVIVFYIYVKFL